MFHSPHHLRLIPMDGTQAEGGLILCGAVVAVSLAIAGLLWLTGPKTKPQ